MQIFLFSNFDEEKKILDTTFCNSEHPETFPWGNVRSHRKFGFYRFSRFDALVTNK